MRRGAGWLRGVRFDRGPFYLTRLQVGNQIVVDARKGLTPPVLFRVPVLPGDLVQLTFLSPSPRLTNVQLRGYLTYEPKREAPGSPGWCTACEGTGKYDAKVECRACGGNGVSPN